METMIDGPLFLTEPEKERERRETNDDTESGKIDGRSNVLEGYVALKYFRQMPGERKSFCGGQGLFSPIPLVVLAVYRVVRYRRKGDRG